MSKMSEMSFSFSLNVMLTMSKMSKIDQVLCISKHVEDVKDVKDRSNTPKGCNAMYVKDGKRTYTNIFAHNFLNIQLIFNPQKVLRS